MSAARRESVESQFENLGRLVRRWAAAASTPVGALPTSTSLLTTASEHDRDRDRDESFGEQTGQTRQWLVLERSMQRRAQAVARRRFVGASALALSAVAGLMVVRGLGRPDHNLSFVASEGTASVGGTVHPEQIPVRLSFSDGSDVVLQPGARGAVIGTTVRGARVRLEGGRARFTVAHRPRTNWLVEAGPFTVVVHGTVFDVVWSRESGELAVDLLVGSVTIKGPSSGKGPVSGEHGTGTETATETRTVTLTAGQRLIARAETGLSRIERIDSVAPVSPVGPETVGMGAGLPPVPAATAAVEPTETLASPDGVVPEVARGDVPAGAAEARAAVRRTHVAVGAAALPSASARHLASLRAGVAGLSASWAARVASGSFQGVVDEADEAGVELCLAKAPADALAALADAARYVRRTDLARQALLAERRRFAGSVGAHDAAFLIGRLAEDTGGDLREALVWYDRYLEQGQHGTYASEALGRKMLALDRLGEAADARVTAQHYLAAYPGGAFATRARRIQSKP